MQRMGDSKFCACKIFTLSTTLESFRHKYHSEHIPSPGLKLPRISKHDAHFVI
jgi:hypothetical protein